MSFPQEVHDQIVKLNKRVLEVRQFLMNEEHRLITELAKIREKKSVLEGYLDMAYPTLRALEESKP